MCANLVLSADLLRSSEDIFDEKPDGKINFFAKNHCDICFSSLGIIFTVL